MSGVLGLLSLGLWDPLPPLAVARGRDAYLGAGDLVQGGRGGWLVRWSQVLVLTCDWSFSAAGQEANITSIYVEKK